MKKIKKKQSFRSKKELKAFKITVNTMWRTGFEEELFTYWVTGLIWGRMQEPEIMSFYKKGLLGGILQRDHFIND